MKKFFAVFAFIGMLIVLMLLSGCDKDQNITTTTSSTEESTISSTVTSTKQTTKATTAYTTFTVPVYTTMTRYTYTTMTIPTYTTATLVNLDREYDYDMTLLSHEYSKAKEEIKMEYDRMIVDDASNYQSLSAEKASLQSECLSKTQPMYNQLSQLERQYAEYRGMSSVNSYYATLATQCQSQINNMRSNISQVESNYLKKIKEIENQMKSIPSKEEREQMRDIELAELDKWYDSEVQKLKDKYGK